MKIYDKKDVLILDVEPDDSSYAEDRIHQTKLLTLYYSLPEYVEIPEGAYTDFRGTRYRLESAQKFICHGDRNFEYTVMMEGPEAALRKYKVRDTTIQNLLKFAYTAKPRAHLELIVKALNRRDSGWTVGGCIEATEKTLSYSHTSCADALQMLADEFKTEWEIRGKAIYLRRVEYNKANPLRLRYGRDCGLKPGVSRDNFGAKKPCEILLVQGGRKNIDASTYGSVELLLPKSQTIAFDGTKFADEAGFNAATARSYKTDATGTEITRADRPLLTFVEDSIDLSQIYPKRVGTVSSVEMIAGKDGHVNYDIIDSSIPEALDYNKALIAGQTMKVIFQSGNLTGREFDLKYKHDGRRFELVQTTYDGIAMPGGTVYIPKVGDTYAVFGCSLPDAYVCDNATRTGASWEMFREAVRVKYENEVERYTFSAELDELYADRHWIEIGSRIVKGGFVLLESDKYAPTDGLLIRITGVRTPVNTPRRPQFELSNVASPGSVSGQLGKIDRNEVTTEEGFRQLRHETARTYEHAKEAQDMLEKALDNFSAGVNPIWVRTMSVLVGNEYQQFMFVDNRTETQREIIPLFEMNNETKVFTAPAAILKHMTMGINKTSSAHKATDYKYWDVAGYTSPFLGGEKSAFYLVAKCAKGGTSGEFLLQETYKYDPGDGFYYFLVGLLSSESGGERSFATAYGYTEILPGQMRIRNIISPDGRTYFNVAEGVIGGNIRIESGSVGYSNLTDKPDLSIYETRSEFKVFADQIRGEVGRINVTAGGTKDQLAALQTWSQNQVNSLLNRQATSEDKIFRLQTAGFITTAQGNALYASAQLANGDTIASYITQSPSAINLISQNISLTGRAEFKSLQSQLNTQREKIDNKPDSSSLGSLAWRNKIGKAMMDETIIDGGYIKTSLIDTNNLIVKKAAQIGDFIVRGGSLTVEHYGDYERSKGISISPNGGVDVRDGNYGYTRIRGGEISVKRTNGGGTVSMGGDGFSYEKGGAGFYVKISPFLGEWQPRLRLNMGPLPHVNTVKKEGGNTFRQLMIEENKWIVCWE